MYKTTIIISIIQILRLILMYKKIIKIMMIVNFIFNEKIKKNKKKIK
jgi:hypothetical protein